MQTKTSPRPLRSSSLAVLSFALLAVAGCDSPDADELGDVALRPGGWGCSHCGVYLGNSPNINGASLSDINLQQANTAGIKVKLGTTPQNRPFQLEVDPSDESFRAIDPQDPEQAGGDAFDLADVGLPRARWVRLIDVGERYYGHGMWCAGDAGGFDLDAIAAIHPEFSGST